MHPYFLLTPGPLSTSRTVKEAMLRDVSTWDRDYNDVVQDVRRQLVTLATDEGEGGSAAEYTAVLVQGSGTFAVEATIGSVVPPDGKLLVAANGAYGERIAQIAARLSIDHMALPQPETEPADVARIDRALADDRRITHVALVHCETTTGMLNPAAAVGQAVRKHGRTFILDAMSSFGGTPLTVGALAADYLISSANKCIEGVPGFGFVIARRAVLEKTAGWARSLSLDLFDQWREMESKGGKWRYTSPTHVVLAFAQALAELVAEGGVAARYARYTENHRVLVEGLVGLGFRPLVAPEHRSPIITAFLCPRDPAFTFDAMYEALKSRGFVIYPGKVSQAETFRVGTIGQVFPTDIRRLVECFGKVIREFAWQV
ncbi:MAG: 2-aminoethylphosphonate--pyruvate transaminase [Planctomycetia bacterium]|nr:2-aminoethylphosphonate--pyruvate transaminase [Planctomycetia bacterium]